MSKYDPKQASSDAAENFARAVNVLTFDNPAFSAAIRREHRTIQQNVGRAIVTLLAGWAGDYETGNYDLRNEDICRMAHEMLKNLDNPPYLRHI